MGAVTSTTGLTIFATAGSSTPIGDTYREPENASGHHLNADSFGERAQRRTNCLGSCGHQCDGRLGPDFVYHRHNDISLCSEWTRRNLVRGVLKRWTEDKNVLL